MAKEILNAENLSKSPLIFFFNIYYAHHLIFCPIALTHIKSTHTHNKQQHIITYTQTPHTHIIKSHRHRHHTHNTHKSHSHIHTHTVLYCVSMNKVKWQHNLKDSLCWTFSSIFKYFEVWPSMLFSLSCRISFLSHAQSPQCYFNQEF